MVIINPTELFVLALAGNFLIEEVCVFKLRFLKPGFI
jgi:hypothetical protein